ncbi:hypothetical protein KUV73_14950 [Mameliella alba]|nr:hypothetical protein [Mameliella alba]MBY6170653.1 hypothetical protein [Mameliella alba]MBY6175671.1 hypothetical protein [Mameliella alba]
MNFPGFVFSTFIMTAVAGSALAQMDGRTGPATMTGAQLDIALGHLNDHLQARYAQDDILAGLSTPPDADFVTVAAATTTTPMAKRVAISGSFGPEISDNASLMAHLVSFNADAPAGGTTCFCVLPGPRRESCPVSKASRPTSLPVLRWGASWTTLRWSVNCAS